MYSVKEVVALLLSILLLQAVHAQETGTIYNVGKPATIEEIQAWDIAIRPDGLELPPGSGTADKGARIFAVKCATCHGQTGAEGEAPRLTGAKSITDFWPFATNIWDYINRAMPLYQEGSLTKDEVYALTAFILFRSGLIKEMDVMDKNSLPMVTMPNQDGYRPPPLSKWYPGMPRPINVINP